jgi:hypothetical protein
VWNGAASGASDAGMSKSAARRCGVNV